MNVLRAGVVYHRGALVAEVYLKQGESLWVAAPYDIEQEDANDHADKVEVLRCEQDRYVLRITPAMAGKLSVRRGSCESAAPLTLDDVRASEYSVQDGDCWNLSMHVGDRGRLVFTGVEVLFEVLDTTPGASCVVVHQCLVEVAPPGTGPQGDQGATKTAE